MKTIQKDQEIKRVKDHEVVRFIKNGWKYVPKSTWKSQFKKEEKPEI